MYSVIKCAALIGCTRTTIYKYLKKDPDRYLVSMNGQRMVSQQGLELLKADVRETMSRVNRTADTGLMSMDGLKMRLKQSDERISLLESENARLTAKVENLTIQHDSDQRTIQVLEQTRADAQKALENEQTLHMQTIMQHKGNWLTRLFGKTPRQTDQHQVDADIR